MIQNLVSFARMAADLGFGRKCLTLAPFITFLVLSCTRGPAESRICLGRKVPFDNYPDPA
jgi:hypothetical protein